MTTPDLRTRVAAAIFDAEMRNCCGFMPVPLWDELPEPGQSPYLREADAAIAIVVKECAEVCDGNEEYFNFHGFQGYIAADCAHLIRDLAGNGKGETT